MVYVEKPMNTSEVAFEQKPVFRMSPKLSNVGNNYHKLSRNTPFLGLDKILNLENRVLPKGTFHVFIDFAKYTRWGVKIDKKTSLGSSSVRFDRELLF